MFSQTKLIEHRETVNETDKIQKIRQKSNAYVSVDFVYINIDKLTDNEQFILEFGKKISLFKNKNLILMAIWT
jgi:uncharacterized protein related to proFAR isomerase